MQSATNDTPLPSLVKSKVISLRGGAFVRLMLGRYGGAGMLTISAVIIVCAALSVFLDVRWIVVALMLLFLVFPMIVAFIYFNHGLKEVTVLNSFPHTLRFIPQGVVVALCEGTEEFKSVLVRYADLDRYYIGGDSIIVPMKEKARGFLWIPVRGFEDAEDFRKAIDIVREAIGRTISSNDRKE